MFGGVTLMVMVTTMIAPPLLKYLAAEYVGEGAPDGDGALDELVNEA